MASRENAVDTFFRVMINHSQALEILRMLPEITVPFVALNLIHRMQ